MAAGDRGAANRRFAAARELLRRELGVDPGPELMASHSAPTDLALGRLGSRPGRLAVRRAQLEAGQAAIAAGALDAGIASLREAAAATSDAGDRPLQEKALAELTRSAAGTGRASGRRQLEDFDLAFRLKVSEKTARNHLSNMYESSTSTTPRKRFSTS